MNIKTRRVVFLASLVVAFVTFANSSNPNWPALFITKPNSIPGATLPSVQAVDEIHKGVAH